MCVCIQCAVASVQTSVAASRRSGAHASRRAAAMKSASAAAGATAHTSATSAEMSTRTANVLKRVHPTSTSYVSFAVSCGGRGWGREL